MRGLVIFMLVVFGLILVGPLFLGLLAAVIGIAFGLLGGLFGILIAIPFALFGIVIHTVAEILGFLFSGLLFILVVGGLVWLAVTFFKTARRDSKDLRGELEGDLDDFRESVRRMRKRVEDLETLMTDDSRRG